MSSTVAQAALSTRLNNLEVPHRQAKVHTVAHKKVASDQTREESAQLLNRAREISGREVGLMPTSRAKRSEVSSANKSATSNRRNCYACCFPRCAATFVQALAERTPGCEVEAVIRLRRAQS